MYKSQLGYLMDLLEITGKDLAMTINVDRTLVSKWKNNARSIKKTSPHFQHIIESLMFFNAKRKDSTLERFFGKVYPLEDKNEPEYLEVCLGLWLVGKDLGNFNNLNDWRTSKNALYATNIEVYQGNNGKRHAILEFFDYALTLPAGQEIFISDLESIDWKEEDRDFSKLYYKKYHQMVELGHNITIIHNLGTHDVTPTSLEMNRYRAYFSGNVTSYYDERDTHSSIEPSLYIIHRHMAVVCLCADQDTANRHIAIYKDPFSVQHYVTIFANRMAISKTMVSTFSAQGGNLKSFVDDMAQTMDKTNIYYTAPELPLTSISAESLVKILEYNKVPPFFYKLLEMIRQQNLELFFRDIKTNDVDLIISSETLKEHLDHETVFMRELSSLCQTEIHVPVELYKELLSDAIKQSDELDNFHISVVPFNDLPILNEVVLWIFEDYMMYAFQLNAGDNFVISDAPPVLDVATGYLHTLLMEHEDEMPLEEYLTQS